MRRIVLVSVLVGTACGSNEPPARTSRPAAEPSIQPVTSGGSAPRDCSWPRIGPRKLPRVSAPTSFPTTCDNPNTRATRGALSLGPLEVRTEVLITRSTAGHVAISIPGSPKIVDQARIRADIARLNSVFQPLQVSFKLEGTITLVADNARFDDSTEANWNALGLTGDRLRIVYVNTLNDATTNDALNGQGGTNGIVIRASASSGSSLEHEAGHFLGMEHTHGCWPDPTNPTDPNTTGDRISDTPPDPGPSATPGWSCTTAFFPAEQFGTAAANCTQQSASCQVTCPGGENPDGRNFMSYYSTACRNQFSTQQGLLARCVLNTDWTAALILPPCPSGQERDAQGVCTPIDSDRDGIPDDNDNCPGAPNRNQRNTDATLKNGDAQGDACDRDDDADCVADVNDRCPLRQACRSDELCLSCGALLHFDDVEKCLSSKEVVPPECMIDGCGGPLLTIFEGLAVKPTGFTKLPNARIKLPPRFAGMNMMDACSAMLGNAGVTAVRSRLLAECRRRKNDPAVRACADGCP